MQVGLVDKRQEARIHLHSLVQWSFSPKYVVPHYLVTALLLTYAQLPYILLKQLSFHLEEQLSLLKAKCFQGRKKKARLQFNLLKVIYNLVLTVLKMPVPLEI